VAIEEAGMTVDTNLVLPVESFHPESAKLTVEEAVKSGMVFDAVLCRDDRFAVAALQALRDLGVEVPKDVAVIGWDDTSLARYSYPTLSSVSPNIQSIAEEAVGMLIERIEGLSGTGRHKLAPYSLHIRESAPALKL
jgi:DNA-binding LacI/PurR family transcriptional regulator